MSDSCTSCKKAPPEVTLRRCAKCSSTPYCSRDCQKADWKSHKKTCGRIPTVAADIVKGLDKQVDKPFTRLNNNTWLHDRSEKDVYRLLIDAHRMRIEDTANLDGEIGNDSVYGDGDESDILAGFRRFLQRTAAHPGILPPWWNSEKQKECEDLAMDTSQWSCLLSPVEKSDMIEHYGNSLFPMQLRMLAEVIYGRGPGGANGAAMRKAMMMMEG